MSATRVLVALAASAVLLSGAELKGTWSAATPSGYLGGSWTAEANQSGAVSGTWMLQEPSGRIVMQGGWSASKSGQSWNGAWRAAVSGRTGEYSGTWASGVSLLTQSRMSEMLESALRAVVSGTWKSGSSTGSWSIRAIP
jgi:hypothetical protein